MRKETLEFLEKHSDNEVSSFAKEAAERKANNKWQKWSRHIALKIVDFMQENNFSRNEVATRLGVSPQYVSKLLSGKINFSLKSIAEIEEKLKINDLVDI